MTSLNTTIAERTGVTFRWAAASDQGKVRKVNEDTYLGRPGVFVVADGMGGHAAGDVASALVARRFDELAAAVPIPVADIGPMVARLNTEIRDHAHSTSQSGMGTTLVAALWVDDHQDEGIVVVNVGDSRCYLSDDGGFRRLTHDHSLVQELLDSGSISPAEAEHHPDRHVITRAMGVDESVSPDFVPLVRSTQQRLVLCSDGVSGELDESRMAAICAACPEPAAAVTSMLDAVLDGRAPDNATVMVVDVSWTDVDLGLLDVEVTGTYGVELAAVDVTGRRPDRQATNLTAGSTADEAAVVPVSEVPK